MTFLRVAQAATFLGVSDDTVRRWIEQGALTGHKNSAGHTVVDGAQLAQLARRNAVSPEDPAKVGSSARNRLVGLVTAVKSDPVMSQVELQCGPHRIVSLMSTEAVEDLGLEPGSVATAVVKSTAVIVETEGRK
ncbi:molybdopterin-binding protein [Kocuria rhizophila]|uniref:Putative molybdenum-pterin binding protein n=1 Tax=Kocuria rhizophila (strain ATCC 9341 / DSM 348 / NBRC 103217 / DC2201) TaxID=378753 RepID=B2GKY1_KOCRD|nr:MULTISPECIES: TOBE domain-containing protein [Kocuria]HBH55908.1 helix-turn-helix domain-containing protein [Kocuria sp.]ASE12340.1 helix-turn-helix domain-containing protein [Kocuria rhizophila]MBK4120657.1 TOBE domain-containing protein [Kocuria rhizophila]MDV5998148.1 TOBE domain-containing protein [Kocuria rhizophila]VEH76178.1 Molybdenum-pterin-binding protein II [Kocuria rhizophila]